MFSLRFRSLELCYSITTSSVCQELFKIFQSFSKPLSKALSRDPPQLSQQLPNYITLKSACQELFSALFKLFQLFSFVFRCSVQLVQSTTTSALCQDLFSSFFKLSFGLSKFALFRYSVLPSRTAWIYYHAPYNLSIAKIKVF